MTTNLSASQEVSLALDILGYQQAMVKWRRHCYQTISDLMLQWAAKAPESLHGFNIKPYLIGSKVEGTTVLYLSDEDYMLVSDCFFCAKNRPQLRRYMDKLWIKVDTQTTDPGYVLLKRSWTKSHISQPGLQAFIDKFIVQHSEGGEYMASETFNKKVLDTYEYLYKAALQDDTISNDMKAFIKSKSANIESEGNSHKLKVNGSRFTMDIVMAFPCENMDFLSEWAERERKYGWPTSDRIAKIMHMGAYIVPKCPKTGKDKQRHLEFRICHTFGEIELMKSLNETQLKLYVLLKELFKSEMDPIYPNIITSYVLKNVVFCLCESTPQEHFQTDLLLDRLIQALEYIHRCIVDNSFIQNYFIPDRNLLDCKLTPDNQSKIGSLISDLIADGDKVVLRIKKLHRGVVSVRRDILTARLTVHFRNLCEIYFLDVRRKTLSAGYAKTTVTYVTKKAYEYIEKYCFGYRSTSNHQENKPV